MFIDLLILLGGIVCVVVGLFALVLMSYAYERIRGIDEEDAEAELDSKTVLKFCKRLLTGAGIAVILLSMLGFHAYQYLFHHAMYMLENFGLWYLIGFVLRIFQLIWEHALFSPRFATDIERVVGSLFVALLGPFQLIPLGLSLKRKRWWEEDD